jgi:hypothetical protein
MTGIIRCKILGQVSAEPMTLGNMRDLGVPRLARLSLLCPSERPRPQPTVRSRKGRFTLGRERCRKAPKQKAPANQGLPLDAFYLKAYQCQFTPARTISPENLAVEVEPTTAGATKGVVPGPVTSEPLAKVTLPKS